MRLMIRNFFIAICSIIFCPYNLQGQNGVSLETKLVHKLTLVADSLTKHLKPWIVPVSIFDVRKYGAIGDGSTLNTTAIQKAIDACFVAGGGTVRIAGGEYVTGTIELKSGVMLEVAKGARLLGSTNLKDYPDKVERFQSVMNVIHKYRISLIYAERAERVGICGEGEIYFRGEAKNFPGPETIGALEGRPFGIRMIECNNVVLKGITLRNSAAWMQSYIYCRDLIFDGITVFNHANHNNDALDPDGCKNVIVRNCFFSSHDDAMCLKSASAKPCENILIENSTFYSTCNAFKLGTDTQGDYRNIIARKLVLGGLPDASQSFRNRDDCSTGITLATVDGGNIENILIQDIEINRSRCPIFLRIGNRGRRLNEKMEHPGYLKNVVIKNIKGTDNRLQGSLISGIKEYPVENVVIRNMDIETVGGGTQKMATLEVPELEGGYPDAQDFRRNGLPAFGFYVRHAQNIYFKNIHITPKKAEERPLFRVGKDVENLWVDSKEMADVKYTFRNPILGGDYPDPTIIRSGEDYYMTHSAFNYLPGLTIFHSRDLVNWQPVSVALTRYLGSVWAPDICKYQGKYYIYFTVSQGNDRFSNHVVYADSPEGPWSEPVDLKIGYWIDPCHVVDESTGQRWLFLSGGHRVKLTDDGLSVAGKLEKVYDGWPIPQHWTVEGMALEGPKMKKIGEYYYFLNAQGGTAGAPTSHMAVVARSKSVDGPWENSPCNPLIHTYSGEEQWWSKGHTSLVDTPDGRWWAVYHAYEKDYLTLGRQTLLEPIEITEDGWLKAPLEKKVEEEIPSPLSLNGAADRHARLDEFRIGFDWKFYKRYQPRRVRVEGDTLVLQAQGGNPAESSPMMFVTGAHKYEISARIECDSAAVAGLILYYNDRFYVGTGCDRHNRHKWRRGKYRGRSGQGDYTALWLKLRNEDHVVTGYYSYDGKKWMKETFGMEISGYNHNTLDDFQSVLPGLFVYGKGKAQFTDFQYKELE